LDVAVHALYRRPRAIAAGAAWHLASWIVGAGEVWLALYFLGHPIGIGQALLLESLGQAVRTAAFVVPGALGVQEGGYLVLGTVLGLTPETSLALALAKRVREVILGVPGLMVWQADAATSMVRAGRRGAA
jgi:putative membrane protein